MSDPEIPSSRQNAWMGAVRKIVNRLPFKCQHHSPAEVGGEDLGDKSIAAGSPFSVPLILYTCLRERST